MRLFGGHVRPVVEIRLEAGTESRTVGACVISAGLHRRRAAGPLVPMRPNERTVRRGHEAERDEWRRLERRSIAALAFSAIALIAAVSWLASPDAGREGSSALIAALHDSDSDERALAAYRASRQPAPDSIVIRELAHLLGDSVEDVQGEAINALIALGGVQSSVAPTVVRALTNLIYSAEREGARVNAAHALGAIGPGAKSATSALVGALESEDANLRGAATSALAELDTPDALVLSSVSARTSDRDPEVRAAAIEALAKLRPDSMTAVVAARVACFDTSMFVRLAAVYALSATSRYASGITALTNALGDRAPAIRRAAAVALAGVGPAAQSASASLARLRTDTNRSVRQSAADALRAISPVRR